MVFWDIDPKHDFSVDLCDPNSLNIISECFYKANEVDYLHGILMMVRCVLKYDQLVYHHLLVDTG